MVTRLQLFAWLAELEHLEAPPSRQDTLYHGWDLYRLAADDELVEQGDDGCQRFGRVLAGLEKDRWIAWDWLPHGGDTRPEQPLPSLFDCQSLQKVRNVRILPEGYAAYAARVTLDGGDVTEQVGAPSADSADGAVFISHAGEDKEVVARPLANELHQRGYEVWYDEFSLELGDSLRQRIDEGLAKCRIGVVILSPAFFAKSWPRRELDGLVARELAVSHSVVLPVWHGVTREDVLRFSPPLADRVAVSTEREGLKAIADRIERALRRQEGVRDRPAYVPPRDSGADAKEDRPRLSSPSRYGRRLATELRSARNTVDKAIATQRWWDVRFDALPAIQWDAVSDDWGDQVSQDVYEAVSSIYTDGDQLNKLANHSASVDGYGFPFGDQTRLELEAFRSRLDKARDLLRPNGHERGHIPAPSGASSSSRLHDKRFLALELRKIASRLATLRRELRTDKLARSDLFPVEVYRRRVDHEVDSVLHLLEGRDDAAHDFLAEIPLALADVFSGGGSPSDQMEREIRVRVERLEKIILDLRAA